MEVDIIYLLIGARETVYSCDISSVCIVVCWEVSEGSRCRHCALCEGVIGDAGALHHTASQGGRGGQLAQEVGGGEGVTRGRHPHPAGRGTWAGLPVHTPRLEDFQNTYTSVDRE